MLLLAHFFYYIKLIIFLNNGINNLGKNIEKKNKIQKN